MSDMNVDEKIQLTNLIRSSLQATVNLELQWRWEADKFKKAGDAVKEKEWTDRADQLKASHEKLSKDLDTAVGQVTEQWTTDGAKLQAELVTAGQQVQDSIQNIQQTMQAASNVVDLIGKIESTATMLSSLDFCKKPPAAS